MALRQEHPTPGMNCPLRTLLTAFVPIPTAEQMQMPVNSIHRMSAEISVKRRKELVGCSQMPEQERLV